MAAVPVTIVDAADSRIAEFREIRERDLTGRQGRFIAEGTVVLRMLAQAHRRGTFAAEKILLLANRAAGVADILAEFPDDVPVYIAEAETLDGIVGFHLHRGVLALGRKLSPETSLLDRLPEQALVIAGCGISNHDNAGSMFRNAAAFKADAIFLDETSCDPLYRKALRVMKLAEKFNLPVVTLIDTAGAYAGISAEERNQSEAIARNLFVMAELKTPIIGVIIGEGGSGGALALGVVDHLMMLQYSTYSVISPEGCASILWKSADKASVAAETLGITATRLKTAGLVDRIVSEPMGGAHRNPEVMMQNLRRAIAEELLRLQAVPVDQLLTIRYERLMSYGEFKEVTVK